MGGVCVTVVVVGGRWVRGAACVRADGLSAYVRSGSAKSGFAAAAASSESTGGGVGKWPSMGDGGKKEAKRQRRADCSPSDLCIARGGGWATVFEGVSAAEVL